MNILVTGATGLLGSTMLSYMRDKGESVTAFNRDDFPWGNINGTIDLLSDFDCIIHAAANTNVEACEMDPEKCYRNNTLLTERLALASGLANAKFVYISSTGIYGTGKKQEPYNEYDDVDPTTHHHKSKWLGEQAVNTVTRHALIIRTGWLFGGKPESPKNFVARRIEEALNSVDGKVYSNQEQKGVPTYVGDVSSKIYELIQKDECGTFNIVNKGVASRFEYVKKIIELAGLQTEVLPVEASAFNRKAKVSNNESAVSLKLQQLNYSPLPHWSESLEKYLKTELNGWLSKLKNDG